MLVEGKPAYDKMVNANPNAGAKAALRQKEQIVIDYMKKTYNIDFRSLQARTQTAIINFTK